MKAIASVPHGHCLGALLQGEYALVPLPFQKTEAYRTELCINAHSPCVEMFNEDIYRINRPLFDLLRESAVINLKRLPVM